MDAGTAPRRALAAAALLCPLALAAPAVRAQPAPSAQDLTTLARAAATAVFNEMAEPLAGGDRDREALLRRLAEDHRLRRAYLGRTIRPLSRREAIARALDRNLTWSIARSDPEKARSLLNEAAAVFDPLFDLTLGYNRQDTYRRTRFGTVRPRIFIPQGNEAVEYGANVSPADVYCSTLCRQNLRRNVPDPEDIGTRAQVVAFEFYENTSTAPTGATIVTSPGRTNGAPVTQWTVSLGLTQTLPWGGTLTLTDSNIHQSVYYRRGHYWEDGAWTANLSATLTQPLPFTKGSGRTNADNTAVRLAEIAAERTDWQTRATLNSVLRDTDTAYFGAVQALETLQATAANRDLVIRLAERMERLYASQLGTRYQRAQLASQRARADLQLEQALDAYVYASAGLAEAIGDTGTLGGSVLYFPVSYADDLAHANPAGPIDRAMATARNNRPELFAQALGREGAEVSLAYAENDLRPDIAITNQGTLGQNGSVYGFGSPMEAHRNLLDPDTTSQGHTLTYTYPLGNRAAKARRDAAELRARGEELGEREVAGQVRREVAEALARLQAARATARQRGAEAQAMRRAYDSIERSALAGVAGEDELVATLRRLLAAETARVAAEVERRLAETGLLYAQGTVAEVLPTELSATGAEARRLRLLAGTGRLEYFGPRPSSPPPAPATREK